MVTNNNITYYIKRLDENTKLEKWQMLYIKDVWVYGGKGSSINKGYENANNVDVRIPIERVKDTSIFHIGDIIAIGKQRPITKQSDLNGIEFYNVTSINVNKFGNNPHIHLGGK